MAPKLNGTLINRITDTELQNYRITELQSYIVTELQTITVKNRYLIFPSCSYIFVAVKTMQILQFLLFF